MGISMTYAEMVIYMTRMDRLYEFQERSAILEFDGGVARNVANMRAFNEIREWRFYESNRH